MELRIDPTDPATMTPQERLDALARVLARAVVDMHARPASTASIQIEAGSLDPGLELAAPSRPDGVVG